MTSPATSPGPAEKPTVYRGVGALIGGALVTLFCLGGAIDLLVEEGSADLIGAAVLLLVATLAFAYGVYPAAFAYEDRLLVRNPMRTISVPWAAVTNLTARLSFVVHTEPRNYTVWSVPVSLRDRRKAERARLRDLNRVERAAARDRRNAGQGGYGFDSAPARRGGSEAIEKLSFADQALTEMNERIERANERDRRSSAAKTSAQTSPETPAETSAAAPQPTVRVGLAAVLPMAAALIFLVVAIIVH